MGILQYKAVRDDAKAFLGELDASILKVKTLEAQKRAIARLKPKSIATSAEKIDLLARAYALSMVFNSDEHAIVRHLAKQHGRTDAGKDRARLFLEVLCPLPQQQAQKTYSRWARAIAHLSDRFELPSAVAALAKKPGQGINTWTRGGTVRKGSPLLQDLDQPVVVSISRGAAVRHWTLRNSSQAAAVERALDGITPDPQPKPAVLPRSKPKARR